MAYSLSNKSAKKFCKRTVLVQLIVEDVVSLYVFRTHCSYYHFAARCSFFSDSKTVVVTLPA